jgi:group II intron reverse transcriptase/maturase
VDTDRQAEEAWILGVQRKLYQWSQAYPDDAWRDMWGWLTDTCMLRHAWRHVASNRGARSAGIDGLTADSIRKKGKEQRFLDELQAELRSGAYLPSPSRRKLIPKAGKPGQFRPLGIPTVKDRVVQCAVKTLLEPIFEAQFWHVSYGFRPGRSTHAALEYIRRSILPRKIGGDGRRKGMPYNWVIEGDIKGCFDNINHHHLMNRIRARVADKRVVRLVGLFLKAGVLAEDQFLRTDNGTPQGGIVSPLLANIALSAIEERYERWTYQRATARPDNPERGMIAARRARTWDRTAGRCVFLPIRYADDFVVLVSGTQEDAIAEKSALAEYLRETTDLELSPEKTKVTAMTDGFEFLGFHVAMRWDKRYGYGPRVEIPKAKVIDFRHKVKKLTKSNTVMVSLGTKLQELNPILRGWANYYRYCAHAGRVFASLDWYTRDRILRWLRKKRPKAGTHDIQKAFLPSRVRPTRRVWREGQVEQYMLTYIPVRRYRLAWMEKPDFAMSSGELDA